jgi:hypothetical protein
VSLTGRQRSQKRKGKKEKRKEKARGKESATYREVDE